MIVRTWRARAMANKAAAYRAILDSSVFPVLRGIDGFVDATLMERADEDDMIEFIVMTRWTSMEAVRAFAGDSYELAVVTPSAKSVLVEYDDTVTHYQITAECMP
jgi:heme-degrading monooxygenase HmoA